MHPFEAQLAHEWPPERWQTHSVVVAVSGGADSVALLCALCALHQQASGGVGRLIVAHYHHGWRGADADADQHFVQQLAARRGLAFETARNLHPTPSGGQGLEATARHQRYAFLLSVAEQVGARFIATAHTSSDQVETVLHRVLRGTGIEGLAGIPRLRRVTDQVALVRPLLPRNRTEIWQYLSDCNESARWDATNEDLRFMRNRLRHQLLPMIRASYQPDVDDALLRLAEDARDYVQALQPILAGERAGVVQMGHDGSVQVERAAFQRLQPLMQRLLLREIWREQKWPQQNMTRQRWYGLAAAIASGAVTSQDLPGKVHLAVSPSTAVLSRPDR